jgi:hypothetical protein
MAMGERTVSRPREMVPTNLEIRMTGKPIATVMEPELEWRVSASVSVVRVGDWMTVDEM